MILCTRELFKLMDQDDISKSKPIERTESFVMNTEFGFTAVSGYNTKKAKKDKKDAKRKKHKKK